MRLTRNIHSFITPFGVESVFTAVLSSSAACYARPQVRLCLLRVAAPAACCAAQPALCASDCTGCAQTVLGAFPARRAGRLAGSPWNDIYMPCEHACPPAASRCPPALRGRGPIASISARLSGLCSGSTSGSDWNACKPGTTLASPSLAPERHFGIKSTVAIACRSRRRRYRRLSRRTSAQSSNGARASCPCRVVILGS
jgi:hypothetical protein